MANVTTIVANRLEISPIPLFVFGFRVFMGAIFSDF
jgi:hypothetical protein